jgi:hypothetical protein
MSVFNVFNKLYRSGQAGGRCLRICNLCLCDLVDDFCNGVIDSHALLQ